jgi:MoaA/NifB/PqqE/SkfB family radical SAM enzyme
MATLEVRKRPQSALSSVAAGVESQVMPEPLLRPTTVCVELTSRCPLLCHHCSAAASPTRCDMLELAAVGKALNALSPLREVYLSGGEPFMHPEFHAIVAVARRHAGKVVAYTSGVVEVAGRLVPIPATLLGRAAAAGVARIDLSLYSDSAAAHDSVTRTPGSFRRTLSTWCRARRLGLSVGVHFVPLLSGAEHFRGVVRLASEAKAERIHILAVAPQGRAARSLLKWQLAPGIAQEMLRVVAERPAAFVLSSRIRQSLGIDVPSERDRERPCFISSDGRVHPSEGLRVPRSLARHIDDLAVA